MNYSPYNFGRLISLIDRKMKSFHSVALERFGLSVSEMPFFLTLTRKDGVSQAKAERGRQKKAMRLFNRKRLEYRRRCNGCIGLS